MRPARVALEAPFRLLSGEGLGDQPARRRIPPGELDAGSLANHAASAIASDEILRADTPAVGQLDVDTVVVLREAGHRTLAIDRHPELGDPAGQNALEVILKQAQRVVVSGGEIADVEWRERVHAIVDLALRQKPLRDPALIEDLDRPRVQAAGAHANEVLVRPRLDNRDVDAR